MLVSKRCSVICDTPEGLRGCDVILEEDATVEEALIAARGLLGEALLDWSAAPIGIYGRLCSRDRLLVDGDRIELYRTLPADPRVARRARVARRPKRAQ